MNPLHGIDDPLRFLLDTVFTADLFMPGKNLDWTHVPQFSDRADELQCGPGLVAPERIEIWMIPEQRAEQISDDRDPLLG